MEKFDFARAYKSYYTARQQPELVDIDAARFISITGKGDPSGTAFAERVQALYTTAYAVKFILKAREKDFVVPKLEGLWWIDEERYSGLTMVDSPAKVPREEWHYRLLIRIPDFVTPDDVAKGMSRAVEKGVRRAGEIEQFELREGKSVQILHVGPFATEMESLLKLQGFMQEQGLERNGLHHEIYLSDFRKTAPEALKTILREPVK